MKKKNHWYIYVSCLIVFLLGFALATPSILSSSFGTSTLEKILSHHLKGIVTIKKIQLGWLTSQKIEGFNYKSSNGEDVFSFETLTTEDSICNLLLHPKGHAAVELQSPTVNIKQTSYKASNESHLHKKEKKEKPSKLLMLLADNFHMQNGNIFLTTEQNAIQFKEIDFKLHLKDKEPSLLEAKGITSVNNTSGVFDIESSFSEEAIYKATINATNFPLCAFDDTLQLDGILIQAFGPMLNAKITCSLSNRLCNISAEMLSTKFKGSLHTTTLDNSISLVKPATFSISITPSLIQKIETFFSVANPLCITKEGGVEVVIDAFKIPYESGSINYKNLSYKGRLIASPLTANLCEKTKSISIDTFTIDSSAQDLASAIDISLKSSFNHQTKNPSSIDASFKIKDVFSKKTYSDLKLDIVKFPLSFTTIDPIFAEILGNIINLEISSSNEAYTVHLNTPRLQIPEMVFSLGESFSIKEQVAFTYTPSTEFIASHLPSDFIKVSNLGKLQGTLESFDFTPNSFNILLKLKNDDIKLRCLPCHGLFTLKNTEVSVTADNLRHFSIDSSTSMTFLDENNPANTFFKEPLQITVSKAVEIKDNHLIEIPSLECSFKNNKMNGFLSARVEDNLTKVVFQKPVEIEILPSSEDIHSWMSSLNTSVNYVLTTPVKVLFNMQPIYLNKPLSEYLAFDAQVGLEKITLIDKALFKEFSFLNTSSMIHGDAKMKQFLCKAASQLTSKGSDSSESTSGMVSCQISSKEFNSLEFSKDKMQVSLTCKGIPSTLIDSLLGYNRAIKVILGSTFDGDFNMSCKDIGCFMTSKVVSPNVNFSGEFSISNGALELQKSSELAIKLTEDSPGAFAEVFGKSSDNSNFELVEPAFLTVTAKKLYWPLNQNLSKTLSLKDRIALASDHLNNSFFDITASSSHMVVQSNINEELTALDDFVLECSKNTQQSPLVFNLKSGVANKTKNSTKERGHIIAAMTLQPTKDKQNRPMLISKMDATLVKFPTMLIDSLFELMGFKEVPPSLFLGKQINATLVTDLENLSGNIDFEVDSTDCKGNLNILLVDGVVKLCKPIQATIHLSPQLADLFLKNMNFDLSVAKNPIQLFISEKGFYFPLDPFDLSQLQIRQAKVDLGQIICTNYGNPFQLSGVFKLSQDHKKQTAFWFAPMDFSIRNGVLSMDRTEVLFNNAYQIAFWGGINIVQGVVDMILGITEQSLRKAFGIRGLPKSFVLQVPMGGPIGNVRINSELATARVAILVAKTVNIDQGGLWGGIVNALSDFANEQESVPPAKPPFPWGDAISTQEAQEKQERTVNIIR